MATLRALRGAARAVRSHPGRAAATVVVGSAGAAAASRYAGGVDPRNTARSLNAYGYVPDYRESGFRQDRMLRGWNLTPGRGSVKQQWGSYKRSASMGRRVNRAADWYSQSRKAANFVRNPNSGRRVLDWNNRRKGRLVRQMVDAAPRNSPTIYRGMGMKPEQLRRVYGGRPHKFDYTSWTASKRVASSFGNRHGKNKNVHVVFQAPKGQRALHIAPVTRYRNSEWIMGRQGMHVVSRRKQKDGTYLVTLARKPKGR